MRCHTTWTVATRAALELEREREHVVDLAVRRAVVARQRHVGAGRRDAHGRPGDGLHEVDAVARALQHLAAAGRLVGEPGAARRWRRTCARRAGRACGSAKSPRTSGQPVDRAPLVADRAHDAGALDRLDDQPARRRDRARRASRGRRGGRARAPRPSPRGAGAAASARARRRAGRARAATPSRRMPSAPVAPVAQASRCGSGSQTQATSSPSALRVSRCVSAIQPQPIRPILMPPPRHS